MCEKPVQKKIILLETHLCDRNIFLELLLAMVN